MRTLVEELVYRSCLALDERGHATVYTVTFDASGASATVVSALQVFRTALDGGVTSLFAVGKMHDTVRVEEGRALLAKRVIRLDTRELGIGTPVPF